ncbi:MAG: hypothetical protein ACO2OV_00305 [Thermoproteota archaeon]|jgi:hypothetical protein
MIILLISASFILYPEIKEEDYFIYYSKVNNLRILFYNKTVLNFVQAEIYFKWLIKNESIKVEMKINSNNGSVLLSNELNINRNNNMLSFKNGSRIGVTLLFLKQNLKEVRSIVGVGLYDQFTVNVLSSQTKKLDKFGYQKITTVTVSSSSVLLYELFGISGYPRICEYDEDTGILIYADSYFIEPAFLALEIISFSADLKLVETNSNLGPSDDFYFFIENFQLIFALLIIILASFFIIRKIIKKKFSS